MSSPFFSVIIPTYNRAGFILKTIQSVLSQQFENFEVLIVDDGSTDNTQEVVQTIHDARVSYFKKENAERAAARNFGVDKSKGTYINFLDSDDLLLPNHLSDAYEFILSNNPDVFHLGYVIEEASSGKVKLPKKVTNINKQILRGNLLSCNGVFIRTQIARQNRFNETRALSSLEDWELWIRLAARFSFMHSNQVTSRVINHDSRSVMSADRDKIKMKAAIFEDVVNHDIENWKVFGNRLKLTVASVSTYVALHLAMAGAPKQEIMNYLWRGIRLNPGEVLSKRFLVIVKLAIGL